MHMHVLVYREIPTRPQTETHNSQTQTFRRVSMFTISGMGMLHIHASVLTGICICLHEWSWYGLARHCKTCSWVETVYCSFMKRKCLKNAKHLAIEFWRCMLILIYHDMIYIYIHTFLITFYMKILMFFLAPSRFLVVLFVEVLGRSPR